LRRTPLTPAGSTCSFAPTYAASAPGSALAHSSGALRARDSLAFWCFWCACAAQLTAERPDTFVAVICGALYRADQLCQQRLDEYKRMISKCVRAM